MNNGLLEGRARAFLRLCRPQFLVPGLILYVLGFLLAVILGSVADMGRFLWGYLVFFLAHFSLTFSNDYFDQDADDHNIPTPLSGGSGALRQCPELARVALWTSLLLILGSLIAAVGFQMRYQPDWYFLPFVITGNLLGFFYTAPPLRLAYRGLGEISTMFAAGIIMPGMGYMCAQGFLDLGFLLLTPVFLAYGAFFILSVEMPDVEGDRAGGKRNLLVRYGPDKGPLVSLLSVLTGSGLLAALTLWDPSGAPGYAWLLLFSVLPLSAGLIGTLVDPLDREKVIGQVQLNFASLIIFLLLINGYFLSLL
ncbi:MAG: prenyltransferase [Methanomassiliicoccales archaeon]|nr:prenyltransferase [Methanomassiliicoccales archaeon]